MSSSNSYQARSQSAMAHFISLTAQARRLLFPPAEYSDRDPVPKSWWQKVKLFLIRSPSLGYGNDASWKVYSVIFWYLVVLLWSTLGLNILQVPSFLSVTSSSSDPSTTTTTSPWLAIPILLFLLALMLVAAIAIPLTYVGVVDFWRDARRTMKSRFAYSLIFVIGLALITNYWLYPALPQHVRQNKSLVLGIYFGLIGPSFIVLYRMLLALLKWIFKEFLFRPFLFVVSAHRPFSQKALKSLLFEPVPAQKDTQPAWRLENLEIAEIRMLRAWAEANREATEKRLLPTTVLFGILGLFGDTDAFNDAVKTALSWLVQSFSTENVLFNLLGSLTLLWAFAFIMVLLNLIANLIVQSLIVEVCLVAEYAKTKTCVESVKAEVQSKSHKRFLNWLWRDR